jgi:hypothetical protein
MGWGLGSVNLTSCIASLPLALVEGWRGQAAIRFLLLQILNGAAVQNP